MSLVLVLSVRLIYFDLPFEVTFTGQGEDCAVAIFGKSSHSNHPYGLRQALPL